MDYSVIEADLDFEVTGKTLRFKSTLTDPMEVVLEAHRRILDNVEIYGEDQDAFPENWNVNKVKTTYSREGHIFIVAEWIGHGDGGYLIINGDVE